MAMEEAMGVTARALRRHQVVGVEEAVGVAARALRRHQAEVIEADVDVATRAMHRLHLRCHPRRHHRSSSPSIGLSSA
jgi:hypothetical protein